jgi:hypothetical protein
MARLIRRRARLGLWLILAAAACCLFLAGCGNYQGNALAREACTHVDRSIQLYREAGDTASSASAAADRSKALVQLRIALPLASVAAGEAGTWEGLEATLSESNRVPEARLIPALSDQCAAAFET